MKEHRKAKVKVYMYAVKNYAYIIYGNTTIIIPDNIK